jgi:5-methylcytosine-specific restriction endonuclease McrA
LKLVITKGTDVANVVHLGRGPNAAQRVALLWTSPQCMNEACSGTFTQVDHRKPWSAKQETVLANCDVLCTHCHRLKTHRGWALLEGRGRRAFVPPSDPRHPRNHPPP